jgi:hypothetical protein
MGAGMLGNGWQASVNDRTDALRILEAAGIDPGPYHAGREPDSAPPGARDVAAAVLIREQVVAGARKAREPHVTKRRKHSERDGERSRPDLAAGQEAAITAAHHGAVAGMEATRDDDARSARKAYSDRGAVAGPGRPVMPSRPPEVDEIGRPYLDARAWRAIASDGAAGNEPD